MARGEGGYRWLMLTLGWLIYFSFGLINTAIAPLVAPIMGDLGLTYTQMGVIAGAWQLLYIFSAQPLGLAIDRLGAHRSLFLGAAVVSASSMLRFHATGFGDLFAYVALFGLGGPLISIGTSKLVSTWFSGEERGTASGINASGSAIGSMAALALTNSLVLPLTGGWRNVFQAYGVFGFSVALIWLVLGGRSPAAGLGPTEPSEHRRSGGAVRELLGHREIWLVVGIGVVFFLANHALQNWLPRMLELKGMSPADAGYATSLMALTGILGSLVVPRLAYRAASMRSTIAAVILLSGASILLIGAGGGPALLAGIASTGFFNRALLPVLMVALMEMPEVGAERMGTAGGLFFSVGEIGGFMGPFLMGYLKDLTGSFLAGILFLAVVTEASIIAAFFIRTEVRRNGLDHHGGSDAGKPQTDGPVN